MLVWQHTLCLQCFVQWLDWLQRWFSCMHTVHSFDHAVLYLWSFVFCAGSPNLILAIVNRDHNYKKKGWSLIYTCRYPRVRIKPPTPIRSYTLACSLAIHPTSPKHCNTCIWAGQLHAFPMGYASQHNNTLIVYILYNYFSIQQYTYVAQDSLACSDIIAA